MLCSRFGKLTLGLFTLSGLSAPLGGCDKKEAPPQENAAPAKTEGEPTTQAEPNPAASEPAAAAEAKPASPADDFAGITLDVTGAPFDGTQTWTVAPTIKKATFFPDTMAVTGVINPPINSADGSVQLGSFVFSVKATGVGTYSGEAVDMTLGLEKPGTGGQPMRTETPHPFTVEVTQWDDAGAAGTFNGTLVRTNDHDGDPDKFTVTGKFAYPRKKR